jgi:hypothetical protein
VPRSMMQIGLSRNDFSGGIPSNLKARVMDFSWNARLNGPLQIIDLRVRRIRTLNAASTQLGCPISLSTLVPLDFLDLSSAIAGRTSIHGFRTRCAASTHKAMLVFHTSVFERYNAWSPFTLTIPSSLQIVRATNASIQSVLVGAGSPTIRSMDLSHNRGLSSFIRIRPVLSALSLSFFACTSCGLQGDLAELMRALRFQLVDLPT